MDWEPFYDLLDERGDLLRTRGVATVLEKRQKTISTLQDDLELESLRIDGLLDRYDGFQLTTGPRGRPGPSGRS